MTTDRFVWTAHEFNVVSGRYLKRREWIPMTAWFRDCIQAIYPEGST